MEGWGICNTPFRILSKGYLENGVAEYNVSYFSRNSLFIKQILIKQWWRREWHCCTENKAAACYSSNTFGCCIKSWVLPFQSSSLTKSEGAPMCLRPCYPCVETDEAPGSWFWCGSSLAVTAMLGVDHKIVFFHSVCVCACVSSHFLCNSDFQKRKQKGRKER